MSESAKAASDKSGDGSHKETVESILMAFILAFIFRAFVVEAFVIPTGSMATTLYGAHVRYTCPDCGFVFDSGLNRSDRGSNDDDIPAVIDRPSRIVCPNCAYDFAPATSMNRIKDPVRFGDRILVLKYLYLAQSPRRWDVVVFKAPLDRDGRVAADPEFGTNYIKRLIGKPNESIVILDGDIYVAPAGANGVDHDDNGVHVARDASQFKIQRKPSWVQEGLWRTVYDNDHIPTGKDRSSAFHQPWQLADGTGWNLGTDASPSRVFNFDGAAGTIYLQDHANVAIPLLTDYLAYDQNFANNPWVGDLKIGLTYTRKSGDGPFRVHLTKGDQCFTAELTAGQYKLYRSTMAHASDGDTGKGFDPGALKEIASGASDELVAGRPTRLELSHCDYRVVLKINGKDVLPENADGVHAYDYEPDVPKLWQRALDASRSAGFGTNHSDTDRPEVRLAATGQSCMVEHLSLGRDIYYLNQNNAISFWGGPDKVVHLGADEYFVLGDNSPISGDARYWNDKISLPHEGLDMVEGGRVPGQFMLGKAFFVYWPAGYKPPFVPVNIVPDFGEMRFIR